MPTSADARSISLRKGLYKRASPGRFNGDGSLIKQTVNEITRSVVAAPILRVWPALLATYEQLGIRPTVSIVRQDSMEIAPSCFPRVFARRARRRSRVSPPERSRRLCILMIARELR